MEKELQTSSDVEAYLSDESRLKGWADAVIFAENTNQVVQIMEHLKDTKKITIQGAQTGLSGGCVPYGGVVLNLSKSNQVLGISQEAKTASYLLHVQAGISLQMLEEQVRNKDFNTERWEESSRQDYLRFQRDTAYYFPADPTEKLASLGGMISCNASGALSYYYGSIRAYIEGLTVVLATGKCIEIHRGQHQAKKRRLEAEVDGQSFSLLLPEYQLWKQKNAVGYYAKDDMDLLDLFIGAEGTLGVVTEAWIRLKKVPPYRFGVLTFFEAMTGMSRFLRKMRSLQTRDKEGKIVAFEFFDKNALGLIAQTAEELTLQEGMPKIEADYESALYFEIHGETEGGALALLSEGHEILKENSAYAEQAIAACSDKELERLKDFRHAAPEYANRIIDKYRHKDPDITAIFTDIAMICEADFWDMLRYYTEDLEEQKIEYIVYGHIGDWHVHVNMLPQTRKEYNTCMELYRKWAQKAARRGGTISAEHGIGKMKVPMVPFMISADDLHVSKKIKQKLDPVGILNVGVMLP